MNSISIRKVTVYKKYEKKNKNKNKNIKYI